MLFDDGEKKAGLEGVYISFLGSFVVRENNRSLRRSKESFSPFCSAADGPHIVVAYLGGSGDHFSKVLDQSVEMAHLEKIPRS